MITAGPTRRNGKQEIALWLFSPEMDYPWIITPVNCVCCVCVLVYAGVVTVHRHRTVSINQRAELN